MYSDALKKEYALKQSEIETISTFYFIGGFFSFFAGIANDRYGPRIVSTIGGCTTATAVFLEWLITRNYFIVTINNKNVVMWLSAANLLWALGNNCLTAPAFSTAIRNFPKRRGAVVGICKGAVGIIGGFLTQMWAGFFFVPDSRIRTADFLLSVVVYIVATTGFAFPIIRLYRSDGNKNDGLISFDDRRIRYCYAIMVLLCIMVGTSAALEGTDSGNVRLAFAIGIVLVSSSLFGVTCVGASDKIESTPCSDDTYRALTLDEETKANRVENVESPLNDDERTTMSGGSGTVSALGDDFHLSRTIQEPTAFVLLFVSITLFGSGTYVTSNVAQMVTAAGLPNVTKSMAVSMFSFSQALSRMAAGYGADRLLHVRYVPDWYGARVFRLVETCVIMALGHLVLALFSSTDSLFLLGISLTGVGFGALHPLLVVCTSEIFGLRHHSSNYTFFDGVGSAIGATCIAKFLVQHFYETSEEHGSTDCYGSQCFRPSHLIVSSMCLLAAFGMGIVSIRCALPVYSKIRRRQRLHDIARGARESGSLCLDNDDADAVLDTERSHSLSLWGRFSTSAWTGIN